MSRRDKNVPPIVLFGQAVPIWVMVNLLGLDGVRLRRELSRTKAPAIRETPPCGRELRSFSEGVGEMKV